MIHERLYYLFGFHNYIWNFFFSNLISVFRKHEWFPCDANPLVFITLFLPSFHSPSFFFSLLCYWLPLGTLLFIDVFLPSSTVFNMSIILKNIHPLSSARSGSFNRNLYLFFMDAFGTTEFRREFSAPSSTLNIIQVLQWIIRSSVTLAVLIHEICAAKFWKAKSLRGVQVHVRMCKI